MKILVIGGSYFYGRVFVMLEAEAQDITVLNRGTYSMEEFGVRQVKGDRKDEELWKSLEGDYDVIVDFCAYEKGDIARVLRNMAGDVGQYIFISTVDVYEQGNNSGIDETAPLETRIFPGEEGAYIAGKTALERELREECGRRGTEWTVLRPAILYGPYNYAPRESVYIRYMVQAHVLPHITDAEGEFQFVYVKDAAAAVSACLLNEKAYGQAYNLCRNESVTYDILYETLRDAAKEGVEEYPLTCRLAREQGIPLPFPVTREETRLYSGEKAVRELGLVYTDLRAGMAKTYRAFQGVYR